MKALGVSLVVACLVGPMALPLASAPPDEKAAQRAMEQHRKAAEAEVRHQAEYERKMVEQQQKAMQAQMNAEKKFVEIQQKAMRDQQKALQDQRKGAQHPTSATPASHANATHVNPPHITTTQAAAPVYHAARPYYGHSVGHAYHRSYIHNYRTISTRSQLDPESRALLRLKASLDQVRMGSPATPAETLAIKRGLMGVVNVPRVPTIGSIQNLANHLTDGLANRGGSAQTGPLAMTLMGVLNSAEIPNADLTEILAEHRSALKLSKVRPTEITPIMESLKTVANLERSRGR